MWAGLLIAISAALLARRKNISGVGAVHVRGKQRKDKRRIFAEIEEAQRRGVPFGKGYSFSDLSKDNIRDLVNIADKYKYEQSARAAQTKSAPESYYNSLNSAFKKISGTNLPYDEYKIYNDRGDLILEQHVYDENKLRSYANDEYQFGQEEGTTEEWAERATIVYIANGGKFIWKGGKYDRGICEELFGNPKDFPMERRRYMAIIGTKDKGALSPVKFAEGLASYEHDGDSRTMLNGVLAALRYCNSPRDAREMIWSEYMDSHEIKEDEYFTTMSPEELEEEEKWRRFNELDAAAWDWTHGNIELTGIGRADARQLDFLDDLFGYGMPVVNQVPEREPAPVVVEYDESPEYIYEDDDEDEGEPVNEEGLTLEQALGDKFYNSLLDYVAAFVDYDTVYFVSRGEELNRTPQYMQLVQSVLDWCDEVTDDRDDWLILTDIVTEFGEEYIIGLGIERYLEQNNL